MSFKKGNLVNLGRKHTQETRDKMSKAHANYNPQMWGAGYKKGNVPHNTARNVAQNAYFAGLVDGEGSILIIKDGLYYKTVITITMVGGDDVFEEAVKRWGGKVNKRNYEGKTEFNDYRVQSKMAEKFIKDIKPYIRLKKKQVELFLQMRHLLTRKKLIENKIPEGEEDVRERIRLELNSIHLNKGSA